MIPLNVAILVLLNSKSLLDIHNIFFESTKNDTNALLVLLLQSPFIGVGVEIVKPKKNFCEVFLSHLN